MNEKDLAKLIRETTLKVLSSDQQKSDKEIPIAASNRHIHLSAQAVDRLFGKGYQLQKLKDLSQPGQFAAKETVTLIGPKGKLQKVRVLGPARGDTQVEISLTDGFALGQAAPLRDSGDIEGTPGITIQGPKGQLKIDKGLICAARHIHMHSTDAERFQVENGERVQVKVSGDRGLTFDNVLIRVSEKYRLEMHIDIDEANAAQIKNGQLGTLLKY
ncbi:propanediol utilization protein [Lottiidibacillus patelloidae]|uniref:Phosphate propanoyltransferase n=1 Tax=Lottiidibacillus patelloidae TaxID=2670334 RepID=A0A263BYC0_9BACI|nr:phosphate propanoyltransferase [Lottiidibacillus patelloidae]OZM58307.1 propanediol utilization protein [Lottiidibacillus patelloidae]